MNRSELLNTLGIVQPALAANDLLPVLTHYWFTGDEVMAYNDVIALSATCKTEWRAALKGSILREALNKGVGKEVDLEVTDDEAKIKCGKYTTKVPVLPDESYIFEFPEPDDEDLVHVKPSEFIEGIETCLQSLGGHISEPERKGIVLDPDGKKTLNLYSTDSVTMSHAVVTTKKPHGIQSHITLSESFCETALKLMRKKGGHEFKLYISEDYVLLEMEKVKLYGRVLDDPSPPKFAKVLGQYMPKNLDNGLVEIPKTITMLLDRAFIVVSKSIDPTTTLSVVEPKKKNGKHRLRVYSTSELGNVTDSLDLDTTHPAVSVKVDLARLREVELAKFDKFMVHERCIVFTKGRRCFHLVSVIDS